MNQEPEEEHFFERISAYDDFYALVAEERYQPAPSDWWVVVCDVIGATQAIDAGRYRDVNTVGAASVAAIRSALGTMHFPFVFGGDGSTALIAESDRAVVGSHLHALRRTARERFDLQLRVGMVPVRVLEERGCPVLVAKFAPHAGLSLAMFGGGGISLAEKLVKSSDEYLIAEEGHDSTLDLTELSCRWQPIAPRRGQVLSLLVQAKTGNHHSIYATIMDGLTAILGGLETVNPVRPSAMHYRSLRELWSLDRQHGGSLFLRFKRMLQSAVAFVLFRLGLYRLLRLTRRYVEATPSHSDYRKFDDMLRMVIDCSEEQAAAIEQLLEERHAAGDILFGLHRSKAALMTCYVQGFDDGEHIHFVDGSGGGYAMAAKQLKEQVG